MRQYNYTVNGTSSIPNPAPRSSLSYSFTVPQDWVDRVSVKCLHANSSDAITWDGHSYNYELNLGKPVRLANVMTGEVARAVGGVVEITVPDSSVAVLNFDLDD
jgi:Glycosyl hydrolase family 79 C-terminal beta domain